MRELKSREMTQRGCEYCLDYRWLRCKGGFNEYKKACIHDACPYHELDNVKTYEQYLKLPSDPESAIEAWIKEIFNL